MSSSPVQSRLFRRSTALLGAASLVLVAAAGPATAVGGRPFTVQLTGAAEVPGPGDPDGAGTAEVTVNPGRGQVCWEIAVTDVEPILAAHIHIGTGDVAGPVVVPLNPYTGDCVEVDRDLAMDLIRNPGGYYVNVHNPQYPAGALRGQLG